MRSRVPRLGAMIAVLAGLQSSALSAQADRTLRIISPNGGEGTSVLVERPRGYASVSFRVLERLGWAVVLSDEGGEALRAPDVVRIRARSPFFTWNDQHLQLSNEPYWIGGELWVPLQLLSDFLPQRAPTDYAFQADPLVLRTLSARAWSARVETIVAEASAGAAASESLTPQTELPQPARRLVVIDPGHGGPDPGARGPGGESEKDVVLDLALALARELETRPELEVRLTRSTDRRVPPWERGAWATQVRGERPGIFLSIHANSGEAASARGFETYFLSEARTAHERRVAALENASFRGTEAASVPADSELDFILKDLGNLDHQHWSELLAGLIQGEIGPVHSGPDRGVKQAPLAVLTNSLMPAVLLEVGFISNRSEERLLASRGFQNDASLAIARAVDEFFKRYPPGATVGETAGSGR